MAEKLKAKVKHGAEKLKNAAQNGAQRAKQAYNERRVHRLLHIWSYIWPPPPYMMRTSLDFVTIARSVC